MNIRLSIEEWLVAKARHIASVRGARPNQLVRDCLDGLTRRGDMKSVLAALDLHRIHRFSIWDSLIVRAALNANCTTLHSEDMSSGQRIASLASSNPFAVPYRV